MTEENIQEQAWDWHDSEVNDSSKDSDCPAVMECTFQMGCCNDWDKNQDKRDDITAETGTGTGADNSGARGEFQV